MARPKAQLGTLVSGSLVPDDLIPAMAEELVRLRGSMPKTLRNDYRAFEAGKLDADGTEELSQSLFDELNNYAPDYCYFGAHPGDGADFGFWLCEDWEQMARDNGDLFVSDLSEVGDYRGTIVHVNDHGNVTLYAKDVTDKLYEIWSVV